MSAPRSASSLGLRLSWWLALQTFFGLGLVCTAVYLVTAMTLMQRQDEALEQKQAVLGHLINETSGAHDLNELKHSLDDFLAGHDDTSLRLFAPSGQLFYSRGWSSPRSANIKERSFAIAVEANRQARAEITLDTLVDDKLLDRLALTLVAAAIAGSVAVSVGCFWLVRLGLMPLHHLVEQTRQLSVQQMDKRLDGSAQPAELQPLIAQFNAMLDRLARAYQQMEGFNADVAHELNTPLATLISSCELALRKARDADDLRETLGSNLEELHRMAYIVADMLFLSSADRGVGARRMPVPSLSFLVDEVVEFHDAALQEAGLSTRVLGDASGWFDARLLRRAVSNLLGTATRYAERGSVVTLQIDSVPEPQGTISISVINDGCEIDSEHLPRLFDRFYRSDPSRAHGENNHGLGLAIVAAIARMHNGQVFASSTQGKTSIGLTLAPALRKDSDTAV